MVKTIIAVIICYRSHGCETPDTCTFSVIVLLEEITGMLSDVDFIKAMLLCFNESDKTDELVALH